MKPIVLLFDPDSSRFSCLVADFQVENVDGVQVGLHGLGPLNFPVRRMIRYFLRRHLRGQLQVRSDDGGDSFVSTKFLYKDIRTFILT